MARGRTAGLCGLPPSRQKEGAKTGHGAFVAGPAGIRSRSILARRVVMLGMAVYLLQAQFEAGAGVEAVAEGVANKVEAEDCCGYGQGGE